MAEKLYFDSSVANNGSYIEKDPTAATPSNVKNNYIFKDADTRDTLIGTMPVNESQIIKINPLNSQYTDNMYTIPEGYHNGTGKVYTGNLSEYTQGTAAAEDVAFGKIFWVNGEKQIGTLNIESIEQPGTATANDIIEGKTAWVNKKKLTGTIPTLPRKDKTLLAGEYYNFPYGLSAGTTIISAASLSSQTAGDATKDDVISGKIAWVNGEKVTGTLNIYERIKQELSDTDSLKNEVLIGKKFYSSKYDVVVSGTMPDHTGEGTRTIDIGAKFAIPEGYYDGQSYITTKTLADATVASAGTSDILNSKTAWVNGVKLTGTMTYNENSTVSIDAGQSYTIPIGYHTGSGKVIAKSIGEQTPGTAVAKDILKDKTAWVNGVQLSGLMEDNTSLSKELSPGEVYYIPEGYHHGSGNVWVKSLKDITAATAIAENILSDKTAWVNGVKLTGIMANISPLTTTLQAGENYQIPTGYHDGNGNVVAATLSSQTQGTAVENDIVNSKTAWVNGVKLTGSLVLSGTAAKNNVMEGYTFYNIDTHEKLTGTLKLEGTASEDDVIAGQYFYSTDPHRIQVGALSLTGTAISENVLVGTTFYNTDPKNMIDGSMPNIGQIIEEIGSGESFAIPKGYHNGTGIVRSTGLGPQTKGTAEASDILKDKTAWVNGIKLTGTMDLNGTATPEFVLSGYTYYSTNPKQKITGAMPNNTPQEIELSASEYYNIPDGYHNGNGKVIAKDLASQTIATATISDILADKTAWVNGSKITGSIVTQSIKTIRIAAGHNITLSSGFYPDGITIYSIYTDRLDLSGTDAYVTSNTLHPNNSGYVDDNVLVITAEIKT